MDELIDVTELIKPEEDPKFFNDEESLEIYQTCFHLMEEFIKDNHKLITEPDFDEIFDEDIKELMHSHFDFDIFYTEEAETEMEEIIEHAKNDFFKDVMPPRSYDNTIILGPPDYDYIKEQLNVLRNKPQPVQRTKEWYKFRHNLITASNAYKAFENESSKNQLIYEKCQPLKESLYIDGDNSDEECMDESVKVIKEVVMVNTNTTLHWGQKYEPLSVKIYEYMYDTKVEDFGCIQHESYLFIGASPDGINVDSKSDRYGRMLEIKNIVNREINGIPKKEYWIQMQLQMEVCDLEECDFLETKFSEYPDFISYKDDTTEEWYEDEEGIDFQNLCLSKDNKMKGSIIYFHTKEGKPFYAYRPLDLIHPHDIEEWQENTVDMYANEPYKYTYMKTIYWKLDIVSCVLVCRNRKWFESNIQELSDIWSIIEKERVSGFEHRAPNRKQKKDISLDLSNNITANNGCLLQFNKNTGKITIVKKETETKVNNIELGDIAIDTNVNV
jgi:putative phage-type endonuclease